jgi:hypothetical protein
MSRDLDAPGRAALPLVSGLRAVEHAGTSRVPQEANRHELPLIHSYGPIAIEDAPDVDAPAVPAGRPSPVRLRIVLPRPGCDDERLVIGGNIPERELPVRVARTAPGRAPFLLHARNAVIVQRVRHRFQFSRMNVPRPAVRRDQPDRRRCAGQAARRSRTSRAASWAGRARGGRGSGPSCWTTPRPPEQCSP